MAKYSDEFKLTIVKEYLKGPLGYKLLAKKYDLPDHTSIQNWVKAYKSFGKEGLCRKHNKKVYTVQFKLDVLNFKKQMGASYRDIAIEFNMNNPSLIANWNRTFIKKGIEGLKPKGRSSMPRNENSKQSKQNKEMSREKLLERENEQLRLEVAYLKKLKAFQENPDAYLEKRKQWWHSSSEKKDSN